MSETSQSVRILLDTDIGSDIDDAVCLAYLLAQPRCQLLGITTVSGESQKRAMIASALCKVAGKDIPIFPGVEMPLLVPEQQPQAPQASALSRWEHNSDFPRGEAIEFMRQTIRAHPGEVVLLTIGPLTNAALLFATDPEIPSLLRGLVMMCGVFVTRMPMFGFLEWNAILDPHAAAMVYRAPVRVHRSIGLDVTTQLNMPAPEVRARFQADLLRPVLDMAEVWFEERDTITFHDPLAACTLFDDRMCTFERGLVEVDLASDKVRGMTHWAPDGLQAPHEVALGVDVQRFFAHFFSVFD